MKQLVFSIEVRIKFINDSKHTCLYIIKIYCINCGSICYSKNDYCKLEYDVILFNNTDNLGEVIECNK